jgi:uracil-DNA glycosylase family 4
LFCHTENDRPPLPEELKICIGTHKKNEWELVKDCKAILLFGKEAATTFLRFNEFSSVINKIFLVPVMKTSKFVVPFYHPGYYVRKQKAGMHFMEVILPRVKQDLWKAIDAD